MNEKLDRRIEKLRVKGMTPDEVYRLPRRNRKERKARAKLLKRLERMAEKVLYDK